MRKPHFDNSTSDLDKLSGSASVTESGIPVKAVYTQADLESKGTNPLEDLGRPGNFPFARGIYPIIDREKPFNLRQYVGFGSVEESNQLFRYLVSQGQTVISVAYDLPTQLGYDSDDQRVDGEVGRIGIPVCSLEDWEGVFDGIDLNEIKVSSVCNAQSVVALAWHFVAAKKRGVIPEHLLGVVQNDILKEFIARGNYIFPLEQSMRLTMDVLEFAVRHLPRYTPLYLCPYHIREAGSDAVQEVAFGIAEGLAYLEAALKRGLRVDDVAPRLSCLMTGRHRDFFEEVAKFRATRRIWAQILKERFGSENPEAQKLRIMQYEGGIGFTAEQKQINIARAAIAAMAGAMGGVQDMGLCTMDEVLGVPTEGSLTIALRTCQIVAHETGITNTIDPLAGSYYVEWLTKEIEAKARACIEKIDSLEGMVEAVKKGYPQREIAETAYRHQKEEEGGVRVVVGRNKFVSEEQAEELNLYQQNPEILKAQIERLKRLRKTRSNSAVSKALDKIRRIAQVHEEGGENNLVPPVIEAVEAYASIGEICGVLRDEWGEYREEIFI
jgi:methylmalonyl-CoA mutase N-terminal domain/subunit